MTLRDILKQTTFLYYGPEKVDIKQLALEWIVDHAQCDWPDGKLLDVSLQLERKADGSITIHGIGATPED